MVSILTILISGCVDNEQSVSTPIPTETAVEQPVETTQRPTEVTTPVETTVIPTFDVGESISDDNTKMILNSVRYATNIIDASVESGNQYVILNITVENIGRDTNITYIWPLFTLVSSGAREGMPNDVDEFASARLEKPFDGEDIRPGDKRQGELVFQIAKEATDLKLRFEYSPDSSKGGQLVIFKLNR